MVTVQKLVLYLVDIYSLVQNIDLDLWQGGLYLWQGGLDLWQGRKK